MSREARGGLKATAGERVTTYHFIHTVSCYFLFLSARDLFSLAGYISDDNDDGSNMAGYAQNHFSTFWTLWTLARLNFEQHIKQAES